MKCMLCGLSDADKKNTHYLTDGIIRSALNEDGSNTREKGLYFDMSTSSDSVEFNFQRSTNVEALEHELGRPLTEEEIENAKVIPFSVDFVFCSACEELFSEIENDFMIKILPQLREQDITDKIDLAVEDVKLMRLFFYLQLFRSSVCDPGFSLPNHIERDLGAIILNQANVGMDDLTKYPLAITYLQTIEDFTTNFVGFLLRERSPYVIFMNDFVIQLYEVSEMSFFDFHGLNIEGYLEKYCNYKEQSFEVKILSQSQRKTFLHNAFQAKRVKNMVLHLEQILVDTWAEAKGTRPSREVVEEFKHLIVDGENYPDKYSEHVITTKLNDFMRSKSMS